MTIHWKVMPTSLGTILVAATDKGVCYLSFNEGEHDLRAKFPDTELSQAGPGEEELFQAVQAAVERPDMAISHIPLDIRGTPFQIEVWQQLRAIPAGETRTYGELASTLGNPGASRAVGAANGANRIAVLIPCHRVIQSDGSLGGYAWGLQIKAELLRREARQSSLDF